MWRGVRPIMSEIFAILPTKSVGFDQMPIEHWASLKCPRNCGPNRYNAHIQVLSFLIIFQVFWIRMGRIAPWGLFEIVI
jgi:hypothetical protein